MKFKLAHAPYIGNKIALDLSNCGFVSILHGLESIAQVAEKYISQDTQEEMRIEEKARDLLEENLDEIEFMQADEHQLFWRIKKKLAENENFILNFEDRYNNLAHKILNELFEEDLIDSATSETRIVNVIFKAINSYSKVYSEIEDVVQERIANYKRKIIFGSEEYDLIFDKLYQEELKKKGFL
ncbi:DUF507 family protein [Helicobacter turcicus]|uniref:DUF507 family protein n=1 Tax=Helicobacter turcicus TaxID=2867412 RepID=A0ABS7JNT7_9HELI|nr:DUF507 family protein [Helicobacter turcicus]MBX7491053.1 DUF507 family protein [Helicobacter turcicus]MBX7546314.1 DUF507 family protein [Helicobacter turcicus]